MSGYQRVALTRGCKACVKAKRKCSRTLPQCQRCGGKRILCEYRNEPLKQGGDLTKTSLEISPSKASFDHKSRTSDSRQHYSAIAGTSGIRSYSGYITTSSFSLDWKLLAAPQVILTLDESTLEFLKSQLQAFPTTYSRTGGTLFIHPNVYRDGQPLSLQFASALCKIFTHIPSTKHEAIEGAIIEISKGLLQCSANLSSFLSKLAFVQALILLQIITLFSPNLSHPLRQQAENRIPLLRMSLQDLWRSVPAYLPASMRRYEAWVLGESCRRTLLFGYKVMCLHSVLSRGCFTLTLFVEALPVDRNQDSQYLWEHGMASLWMSESVTGEALVPKADLVSYRELTDMWDAGVEPQNLYEEMLVAACKGVDNVKRRLHQAGEISHLVA